MDRQPVTAAAAVAFDDGLDAAARAAAWLEQAARVRAGLSPSGIVDLSTLAGHTGLDLMQGITEGRAPPAPIMDVVDALLLEVSPGRVLFQGHPGRRFYNPIGSVHGGWIATLMDSAVGCAVHTALPRGQGYTTLELKVNYLRAVTDTSGPLRAEGRVIHLGRQTAIADGQLYDASGRVYAHATTTCLVFPLPAG